MNPGWSVRCSTDEAVRDSSKSVGIYLARAVAMLDSQFGEGYAKKNPSLVATLVSAQTQEFTNAVNLVVAESAEGYRK